MGVDDAKRALSIGAHGSSGPWGREWIKDKMEEMTGTRELEEANRRMDVVWEWRDSRK